MSVHPCQLFESLSTVKWNLSLSFPFLLTLSLLLLRSYSSFVVDCSSMPLTVQLSFQLLCLPSSPSAASFFLLIHAHATTAFFFSLFCTLFQYLQTHIFNITTVNPTFFPTPCFP